MPISHLKLLLEAGSVSVTKLAPSINPGDRQYRQHGCGGLRKSRRNQGAFDFITMPTVLTVVEVGFARYAARSVFSLLICVPCRTSRLNATSIPSARRSARAPCRRPASARGVFGRPAEASSFEAVRRSSEALLVHIVHRVIMSRIRGHHQGSRGEPARETTKPLR